MRPGKMQKKGMNMIVANDVSDKSIGFSSDVNEVTVLAEGLQKTLPRASKKVLARKILSVASRGYHQWKRDQEQ